MHGLSALSLSSQVKGDRWLPVAEEEKGGYPGGLTPDCFCCANGRLYYSPYGSFCSARRGDEAGVDWRGTVETDQLAWSLMPFTIVEPIPAGASTVTKAAAPIVYTNPWVRPAASV